MKMILINLIKEIYKELFRERYDEIVELTDKIDPGDLIYYLKVILLAKHVIILRTGKNFSIK